MSRVVPADVWDVTQLKFNDAVTVSTHATMLYTKSTGLRSLVQLGEGRVVYPPRSYQSMSVDFSENQTAMQRLRELDAQVLVLAKAAKGWRMLGRNPSEEEIEAAYKPVVSEEGRVTIKVPKCLYFNKAQEKADKEEVVEGSLVNFLVAPAYLVFMEDKFGVSMVASQALIVGEAANTEACLFML